jgi:ABC-type antimicrobial peptide transport system permease subunit
MLKSTTSKQNYNHEDQCHVQQHQSIQSQQHTCAQFVQHDDRYYDHNTNSSTLLHINDDDDTGLQQQQPQDLRDVVDYVDQELLESFAESLSSMDYTTLCIMNHKSREDNNNNNNDATIIHNNNNNNNDNIYMNRNQSHLSSSNSVSMNDLHLLSTQDLLDPSIDNFPLLFPGINNYRQINI